MIYKKFIIEKYKALQGVEINLKNPLIPIIGINESGKSSLLHAILAFDRHNDGLLNGAHLSAKNRYDYESVDHTVTAYLELNEDDIKSLRKSMPLPKTSKVLQQLELLVSKKQDLILSRNLDTKSYELTNVECEKTTADKLVSDIFTMSPYILFFDDFNDRVPDKIFFEQGYLSQEYDEAKDVSRSEWNSYIEEIFTRATNDDLRTFLKNSNKNDRDGILSDVNDTLNVDIIQNWKKLKVLKKELTSENIIDLKLNLDYTIEDNKHVFTFKVIDKNFKKKGRFFSVTERSKGFQWFFNFAIKLKYNPKYVEGYDGAIYLLDEPGSYLHSSAQEELLKSLKEISGTNRVIYCTHSQYLLSPDVINLSSIKIAIREDGVIKFQNFGEYKEVNKNQGSLSPVYDALHLNIAKHDFPRNQSILITEGIIDYYVLLMAKEHLPFFYSQYEIIPGASVTNLKDLISLSIAWSKRYSVLFDSDEGGVKAFKQYQSFFLEDESSKWILLSLPEKNKNIEIESFFDEKDQQRLILTGGTKEIKKAISLLYHDTKTRKNAFFSQLSDATISNFKHLSTLIEKKLK